MHELFYCSYAREDLSTDEILRIVESSVRNNEKLGITGILVFWHKTNQFLQVLEGEEEAIFDLFENTIRKDPRHSRIKLIYHGPIAEKGFKGWSMAFKGLNDLEADKIKNIANFSLSDFSEERTSIEPSIATRLIVTFKDFLP